MSMIYSFYDVGEGSRRGPGTYIILNHINRAARASLPFVYFGYWVQGSDRIAYKESFKPLERHVREGWRRMDLPDTEPVTTERRLPTRSPRRILVDA